MSSDDTPKSVRIRTGAGNEWRYSAIQEAANFYDVNRTDAVAYACEDITNFVNTIERVLNWDDFTVAQRRELANEFSVRGVSFDVVDDVHVTRGGD